MKSLNEYIAEGKGEFQSQLKDITKEISNMMFNVSDWEDEVMLFYSIIQGIEKAVVDRKKMLKGNLNKDITNDMENAAVQLKKMIENKKFI